MDDPREGGMPIAETAGYVSQLLAVGQKRRAQEIAAGLVARDPEDPSAHLVLSQVLLSVGELLAAQAAADESSRLDPDDERTHAQRGRVLLRRGCFARAERAIERALALDPQAPDIHILRARLLSSCGRYGPALDAVEEALTLDPDDSEAHQWRATLLLQTKPREWHMSEATARRALALDPDDADAHAVLGSVFLRSNRLPQAEERFRSALTLDPTNALALRGLSEVVMARSIFYRPFLRFSMFLQTSGAGTQLAIIAGLWALVNAADPLLRSGSPPLPDLAGPLRVAYLALCVYTWFVAPVTRFILARQYPWLRALQ